MLIVLFCGIDLGLERSSEWRHASKDKWFKIRTPSQPSDLSHNLHQWGGNSKRNGTSLNPRVVPKKFPQATVSSSFCSLDACVEGHFGMCQWWDSSWCSTDATLPLASLIKVRCISSKTAPLLKVFWNALAERGINNISELATDTSSAYDKWPLRSAERNSRASTWWTRRERGYTDDTFGIRWTAESTQNPSWHHGGAKKLYIHLSKINLFSPNTPFSAFNLWGWCLPIIKIVWYIEIFLVVSE